MFLWCVNPHSTALRSFVVTNSAVRNIFLNILFVLSRLFRNSGRFQKVSPYIDNSKKRQRSFADRVSANRKLFADTIHANKMLFADSGVPIEKNTLREEVYYDKPPYSRPPPFACFFSIGTAMTANSFICNYII